MNPVSTMSTGCHQHQEQHPLHGHHHHNASSGYHHHHRHHRHSPKSQSIPIQRRGRSSMNGDYLNSQRIREEEMMADYVDYCFCERLVSGMQRKVSFQIHDISLRYENQALIDHIIMTRRSSSNHNRHGGGGSGYSSHDEDGNDESSPPSSPPISPTLRPRIITAPLLGDDGDLTNQRSPSSSHIEDEMIFDMEL